MLCKEKQRGPKGGGRGRRSKHHDDQGRSGERKLPWRDSKSNSRGNLLIKGSKGGGAVLERERDLAGRVSLNEDGAKLRAARRGEGRRGVRAPCVQSMHVRQSGQEKERGRGARMMGRL